jgi:AcrR family transcriptional regulator
MAFATRRFAEGGYHPTSVAEIVTGLGVGKGVFYWYFESKEALFLEILRDGMTDLRRSQHQLIADVDDPVERIRLGILATARWSATHRDLYGLTQFAATQQQFAPAVRKGRQIAVDDTIKHVRDGIGRGVIREVDPDYLAHAILGVTGQLVATFIHHRDADPDEVAQVAASIVLDGILVTPAPTSEATGSPQAGPAAIERLNPAS